MPFEIVDMQGFSPSSIFSEELHFPNERQVGFWKTESMLDHHGRSHFGFKLSISYEHYSCTRTPELSYGAKLKWVKVLKSKVDPEQQCSNSDNSGRANT